jgi:hypothetical protein
MLRLRAELDMIEARGPRWRRNGHKPPTSAGELKQAVVTLRADGLTDSAIAATLGIDVDRVQPLIDSHHIRMRQVVVRDEKGEPVLDDRGVEVIEVVQERTTRRRRRSADETRAMVASLWREQPNTIWIAGRLGITPKRVHRLLREQGLLGGSRPGGITPSNAGLFGARVVEPISDPVLDPNGAQMALFEGEAIDRGESAAA